MDRLPPFPRAVPIMAKDGNLTPEWDLWLSLFVQALQTVGDDLDALSLTSGGTGGGVASAGAGPAVDLTYEASAEGTSNLGSRANHTHEMAIGIEQNLSDRGIANDLNFDDAFDVNVTRLVSAWKMEEATGNRTNEVTASQYLYEIHGTVNGETGHIGDAFRPVIDTLDRDYRTYGEWLRSTAYVNWYPLGPSPDPATEQTTGVAVSGTVVVLFKPETGIVATGNHVIGGLASFNSFPYQILSVTSGWDGATYSVRGYTTLPGSVDKSTGWTACALDTWHVGFVWFDHRTETLGFQLDNNPPQLLDCGSDKIWYGTYTYWMSGPRFKGLVDSSLLFKGVLSNVQREALYDSMLTAATDIDFVYEAKRNRATIEPNYPALELFGG